MQAEPSVKDTGPEWQGKLHALEKMIKTSMEKHEEATDRGDAQGLKTEILDLRTKTVETAKQIADLRSQMNKIEAENVRIADALAQLAQTNSCSTV